MYTDRPMPSLPYLALLVLCTVISSLPLLLNFLENSPVLYLGFLSIPLLLLLCLDVAAFTTRYCITSDALEVGAWPLFRKRVPLHDIRGVQYVGMIRRVLGWAPGCTGCCNRMTNGLAIFLPKGVLYISPQNAPELELRLRQAARGGAFSSTPQLGPSVTLRDLRLYTALMVIAALPLVGLSIPLILGLVPPNDLYGVRTSATLADPEVWRVANVRGGWSMLAAGCASLGATFFLYRKSERLGMGRAAGAMLLALVLATLLAVTLSLILIPG